MAEKLFECEWTSDGEIILRIKKPGMRMLTPEVRGHMLGARREMLSALRSLIDAALERMEEKKPRRTRRTQIKVE